MTPVAECSGRQYWRIARGGQTTGRVGLGYTATSCSGTLLSLLRDGGGEIAAGARARSKRLHGVATAMLHDHV
jgi:hypothetical protein